MQSKATNESCQYQMSDFQNYIKKRQDYPKLLSEGSTIYIYIISNK